MDHNGGIVQIARTPAFKLDDIYDLSKDEIRERTMEKFATMVSVPLLFSQGCQCSSFVVFRSIS